MPVVFSRWVLVVFPRRIRIARQKEHPPARPHACRSHGDADVTDAGSAAAAAARSCTRAAKGEAAAPDRSGRTGPALR